MAKQSAQAQPAPEGQPAFSGSVDRMIYAITKGKHRLSARYGGPGQPGAQAQQVAGTTGPSPSYTGG